MYVCTCVYTCTYMCIYSYICAYMYVHVYTCACMYIHVYIYIYTLCIPVYTVCISEHKYTQINRVTETVHELTKHLKTSHTSLANTNWVWLNWEIPNLMAYHGLSLSVISPTSIKIAILGHTLPRFLHICVCSDFFLHISCWDQKLPV